MEGTDRRTAGESAPSLQELSDTHVPDTARIVRVQDHRNPHVTASLSEACAPQEARRLVERCAWHATPQHGSSLPRAASEWAPLARPCLDRRLPDHAPRAREGAAWQGARHTNHTKADWPCPTEKARITLKRLYPVM